MNAIPIDDYFAAVESRFDSQSPYGRHQEGEDVNEYKCDQCGKTFGTEQGLRVHKGRSHSKMARKPKADHPWKSPAVIPDTAPEQKVDAGKEPLPDYEPPTCEICDAPAAAADPENGIYLCAACIAEAPELITPTGHPTSDEPSYRMELIETLCDLAACQLGLMADADTVAEVGPTIARIKAVARHE